MTEAKAKTHLRKMLRSFTGGTVLHLFAEVFGESAEEARRGGDECGAKQCQEVAAALYVTGLGIDSVFPPQ